MNAAAACVELVRSDARSEPTALERSLHEPDSRKGVREYAREVGRGADQASRERQAAELSAHANTDPEQCQGFALHLPKSTPPLAGSGLRRSRSSSAPRARAWRRHGLPDLATAGSSPGSWTGVTVALGRIGRTCPAGPALAGLFCCLPATDGAYGLCSADRDRLGAA